ncbi:potassium channel family protein [Vibrio sp. 10N.222.49.E5]
MVKLNKELTVVSAIRVMVPVAIFIFYIWAHFIYHKDTYYENKIIDDSYKKPKILGMMIIIPLSLIFGGFIGELNSKENDSSSFLMFIEILKGMDVRYVLLFVPLLIFSIALPKRLSKSYNLPTLDLIIYTSVSLIVPFLLIGMFFSGVYAFLQISGYGFSGIIYSYDFIYFSFVTQTTLGYGEMTPTSVFSKYVVIAQSIIGIFYMGVAVSVTLGVILENGNNRKMG